MSKTKDNRPHLNAPGSLVVGLPTPEARVIWVKFSSPSDALEFVRIMKRHAIGTITVAQFVNDKLTKESK